MCAPNPRPTADSLWTRLHCTFPILGQTSGFPIIAWGSNSRVCKPETGGRGTLGGPVGASRIRYVCAGVRTTAGMCWGQSILVCKASRLSARFDQKCTAGRAVPCEAARHRHGCRGGQSRGASVGTSCAAGAPGGPVRSTLAPAPRRQLRETLVLPFPSDAASPASPTPPAPGRRRRGCPGPRSSSGLSPEPSDPGPVTCTLKTFCTLPRAPQMYVRGFFINKGVCF